MAIRKDKAAHPIKLLSSWFDKLCQVFLFHSASPKVGDRQPVRAIRQNGGEFTGSFREASLSDALELLEVCIEEFEFRIANDENGSHSRGFRLVRDEADYLAISVVGDNEIHVTTSFLGHRDTTITLHANSLINFSAETLQVKAVLHQYFSEERGDFEHAYLDYLVDHIPNKPWKLAYAIEPENGLT